jgi:hypothetical protein
MAPESRTAIEDRMHPPPTGSARSERTINPALVFACGISGVFTNFGFRVLQATLDVLTGGCDHIRVSSLDDLRAAWPQEPSRLVEITSEEPSIELSMHLIASGAPLLLFCSRPEEHMADFIRFGCDFPTAVHFASKRLTLLQPLRNAPASRKLHCPPPGTPLRSFVKEVAEGIVASPPYDMIEQIVRRLVPDFPSGDEPLIETVLEERSDLRRIISDKAPEALPLLDDLNSLVGCASADEAPWTGEIVWPNCVFRNPNDENKQAIEPIELTGPARPLVLGPHFYIPPGHYRAAADFMLDRNTPANAIDLLVTCGTYTGSGQIPLPSEGNFTVEFPLVVPDPSSIVEIRFRLLEGAIDGSFKLGEVRLTAAGSGAEPLRIKS